MPICDDGCIFFGHCDSGPKECANYKADLLTELGQKQKRSSQRPGSAGWAVMHLEFHSSDKMPNAGNESQYLLLVGCNKDDATPGEPFPDVILWGVWYDDQWWIVAENYHNPEVGEVGSYGEALIEMPFEKLATSTFFTLKGWREIWSGVGPA